MTVYIHDEWCEMRLGGSSECNCYVGVIRGLEARIEALEKGLMEIALLTHIYGRKSRVYEIAEAALAPEEEKR